MREVRGQEEEEEGEEAQRHSWKFIYPSADGNITAPSSLTEGLLSAGCSLLWKRDAG